LAVNYPSRPFLAVLIAITKSSRVSVPIVNDKWYTGPQWLDRYVWYSWEKRAVTHPSRPFPAVPTTQPSRASVPIVNGKWRTLALVAG